ncbi:Armadillo-type fold [Sesbania bispinosa]|nr:Armadillo-type fold [Sesbania bispinosa]
MVSLEDSRSNSSRFPLTRTYQYQSSLSSKTQRHIGRSMRTIRSNFFQDDNSRPAPSPRNPRVYRKTLPTPSSTSASSTSLLGTINPSSPPAPPRRTSSISPRPSAISPPAAATSPASCSVWRACLRRNTENFSTEIIESISPEDLQPTVKLCIDGLQSPSVAVKRSAAAKLRLLAKNRADNRVLIGESGAVAVLVPLLRCSDPWTQEHAVTALLNLSLHEDNKKLITNARSREVADLCAEDRDGDFEAERGVRVAESLRGRSALTTLYKLCSVKQNKERAVSAGAVKPLVELVAEQGNGMAEKAMVVLNSLAGIQEGKDAIVEEGGIAALVEAIEDGSVKGKEFAVLTLLQLCADSVRNRGFLVREGGIPPLVALSQTGTLELSTRLKRYFDI